MSEAPRTGEVTDLLRSVANGDAAAADRLADILHADLRRLAASFLAGERKAHTLQPTALVHEAWLRFMPGASGSLRDRGHFMGVAARVMRRILVEHARARLRDKRGGTWQRVSLAHVLGEASPETALARLLDLHEALEELSQAHPRTARVLELRAFGGLTIAEAAEALQVSESTVEDDWMLAKAWLSRALRHS